MKWITSECGGLQVMTGRPVRRGSVAPWDAPVSWDAPVPWDAPTSVNRIRADAAPPVHRLVMTDPAAVDRVEMDRVEMDRVEVNGAHTALACSGMTGHVVTRHDTPGGGLARGALHELLFVESAGNPPPATVALLAAKEALAATDLDPRETGPADDQAGRPLVWCDPYGLFYPPAAAALGVALGQVYVIRPGREQALWATAECLRCPGVGAVVASLPERLSQVDARRLQLAAEKGGGVGLMLRPWRRGMANDIYAAATRWLVRPATLDEGAVLDESIDRAGHYPSERHWGERRHAPQRHLTQPPTAQGYARQRHKGQHHKGQRWVIEFIHGQGWRTGESFILECRRGSFDEFTTQAVPVYLSARLADRAPVATLARAWG